MLSKVKSLDEESKTTTVNKHKKTERGFILVVIYSINISWEFKQWAIWALFLKEPHVIIKNAPQGSCCISAGADQQPPNYQ